MRGRAPAQRDTSPDFWTDQLVQHRFGGRCVRCGRFAGGSVHHRRPRGQGGSSDPTINALPNLLWLCGSGTTGCHGWIEHHRAEAREHGLLVPYAVNAALIPVRLWDHRLVMLTDTGSWTPAGVADEQ